MKRFLLFAYDSYYPCGGWGDWKGSFDSDAEAKAAIETGKRDWWEIVDLETESIVYSE